MEETTEEGEGTAVMGTQGRKILFYLHTYIGFVTIGNAIGVWCNFCTWILSLPLCSRKFSLSLNVSICTLKTWLTLQSCSDENLMNPHMQSWQQESTRCGFGWLPGSSGWLQPLGMGGGDSTQWRYHPRGGGGTQGPQCRALPQQLVFPQCEKRHDTNPLNKWTLLPVLYVQPQSSLEEGQDKNALN